VNDFTLTDAVEYVGHMRAIAAATTERIWAELEDDIDQWWDNPRCPHPGCLICLDAGPQPA
jgi:hypothetical protein